jgi:hypothetical protein
MASSQNDPNIIGRMFFLWTVFGALAFAIAAFFLTT